MTTLSQKLISKFGEAQFLSDYNPKGTKYLEIIAIILFHIHKKELDNIEFKE